MVPKTVHFKIVSTLPIAKIVSKIPRCSSAVFLNRGTAQLCVLLYWQGFESNTDAAQK